MSQLALPLQLEDHAVFASFLADGNEEVVAVLSGIADATSVPGCWIWGRPAAGKSHLLQAVCSQYAASSAYLPLADLMAAGSVEILLGMAERAIICIDDVHCVAGRDDWEQGLFRLFNEAQESGARLIFASAETPRNSGILLPDLASRCSLLPVYQVHDLDEPSRGAALQLRARHRGLKLPDETARFLLTRTKRDMASLYGLLDKLDAEALVAQKPLTVPFVRSVLRRSG